jgi:FixJ family two-component response regulator
MMTGVDPSAVVFILDDDESVRRGLTRTLAAAGFVAKPFASAEAMLDSHPSAPLACVIADLRMPGVWGTDVPRLLREQGLRYPVILITAYDSEQSRAAAQAAGVAAYFRKPVDDQALIDAVVWAMRKAEAGGNGGSSRRDS